MAQSDLAKRFNIKSIWEPYLKERGGQAYFEPRTAWAAPTYEYWWPFPFPAPGTPNAQGEVPTVNPGLVTAAEGPAGLASSAPTTMIGSPAPTTPPRTGNLTQDMESLLPGLAAGTAAGAALAGQQPRQPGTPTAAMLPNPLSFVGGGGAPAGPVGAGGPGAVGAGTVGAGVEGAAPLTMGAATPATAGAEALSEAAGRAAGAADLFGQPGEVLTSGAYAPGTAAPAVAGSATAGAEAGALAGSSSAAQGAVGPALEAGAEIGPGVVAAAPFLLAGLVNFLSHPERGFFGIGGQSDNFHKTMAMHGAETASSQGQMANLFQSARSPADVARIYTGISGTPATAEDVVDPSRRTERFRFPLDAVVRPAFEGAIQRLGLKPGFVPGTSQTWDEYIQGVRARDEARYAQEQAANAWLAGGGAQL